MEESDAPRFTFALKRGALLAARYRIDRLLADSSSFALTYLATDTSPTDGAPSTIAIKEFLPRVLVGRSRDGCTVQPHSPADGREFGRALRRFVHEAEALADIESPNLVRVHGCLEENGTAYILMAPRQGRTLLAALSELGGAMSAPDAVGIVLRLLEPLERMHSEGVFHRAISPEAVAVSDSWEPTLHGFSARRHVSSEASEIVPGFAAFEQYGSGDVGPWTDVYACSAILYYLVTGVAPPAAIERAMGKPLAPVGWLAPDVSPELSQVIGYGLSLMPEQRPHGVAELRKQLEGSLAASNGAGSPVDYEATGSAFIDSPSVADASFDGSDSTELQLSNDAVEPGDENARPRFAPFVVGLATRIRDGFRPMFASVRMPKVRQVEARVGDAIAADVTPEPDVAPSRTMETGDAERVITLVPPSLPKSVAPDVRAWATDSITRRGGAIRYAAAILIVAVTGSTYWVLMHRLNADLKPAELGSPQLRTATADSRSALAPNGAGIRVPGANGPLQQGVLNAESMTAKATRRTERGGESVSQSDAGGSALPTLKRMNLSTTVDADRKLVPVDVLLDLRTQLTNGKEQADQGQYVLARRIFASALTATDGALDKYSGAESLRSIRAELDSASRRAVRACQAENDVLKKRGGTVVPCE